MLQILSTSNETSTGAELVQNGNFSEIGSDLVTNGDFSAAGINLVDNPNFTDTGSELVTNGDFTSASGWNINANWTIDTGAGTISSDGTSNNDVNQGTWFPVLSKSYKIVYTIDSITQGEFKIKLGGVTTTPRSSAATYTEYITTTDLSDGGGRLRLQLDNLAICTISNVSVKELGADWTEFSGDPDSVSFGENGVTLVQSSDLGSYSRVTQSSVTSADKSYKVTYTIFDSAYTSGNKVQYYDGDSYVNLPEQGVGTHTFYYTREGANDTWIFNLKTYATPVTDFVTISSISVQELGEGWTLGGGWSIGEDKAVAVSGTASKLQQTNPSLNGKSCKVTFTLSNYGGAGVLIVDFGSTSSSDIDEDGTHIRYGTYDQNYFQLYKSSTFSGDVTNVIVQELDPNGYWTLGTGWSIGADKAISTVTGSDSDITQSILTVGKTYRTVYEIVDYDAGTAQAIVTGSDGADAVAIETYTEDLTTTGTDFSIRSKLGTFDGAVSSVSVKQLGTYEDQSIYVTAADVQTIAQASVYYLIELTSMGSKNSLYFLPSSVVPNNGRYTKLNFTVISKDALPQPTVGIISFYDSVGGLDTYPMGFYEFKIYEQTSSTNLDPLLSTGLLEKGFAFVRDFSGNMQELTDGFKEYTPALTQYVYSK